ncbi:MAG: hypothetical protein ACREDC_09090 [Bradyrhizobium sp.]
MVVMMMMVVVVMDDMCAGNSWNGDCGKNHEGDQVTHWGGSLESVRIDRNRN